MRSWTLSCGEVAGVPSELKLYSPDVNDVLFMFIQMISIIPVAKLVAPA